MSDKNMLNNLGIGKNLNKKWERKYVNSKDTNTEKWKSPNHFNGSSPSVSFSDGSPNKMASTKEKFCGGKSEENILSPLANSLYDVAKLTPSAIKTISNLVYKAFDMYGNAIYRLIEGKPYGEQIEGDKINIDNIAGKYKFVLPNEFKEFTLNDSIGYVATEGEKEGLKACVGIDAEGEYHYLDILKGHLLIGACSEWGKSNLINIYLTNLIRTYTTNEFRYMLCDYKSMDLVQFERYEHCIGRCVTDKKGFLSQVKYLEDECKRRTEYVRARDYLSVKDFNLDLENKEKFPYIVYVIDELPMVVADNQSKTRLIELMRLCRVGGIYVILATQDARKVTIDAVRMLVSQVAGLHVATKTDSDTLILDADLQDIDVKGRFKIAAAGEIKEVQSFYLSAKEIKEVLKPYAKSVDK